MKKILLFGANGQLGQALQAILPNAIIPPRTKADFTNEVAISHLIYEYKPNIIINAAAYTAVDKAEMQKDLAYQINAYTPALIAKIAKEIDAKFIHYSTDYVFDGNGNIPWKENDQTNPLNIYGHSKLAGEQEITKIDGDYMIFRTSWVYDTSHNNFLNIMLNLTKTKDELTIVTDQIGSPTYAPHLAKTSVAALQQFTSGIYHLCNEGRTSWYDFAKSIFATANINIKLNKTTTAKYKTPAKRPLNSRLNCTKAKDILNITMPNWQEGLKEAIKCK